MNDDLHLWSGLYATDALEGEDLERFEQHLATCADCQAEVVGFQETTAQLAQVDAEQPPASLRASVLGQIAQTRQDPPVVPDAPDQDHAAVTRLADRRRGTPWLLAVAAALMIVAGIAAYAAVGLSHRATKAEDVAAVLTHADARTVNLTGDNRAPVKLVWSPAKAKAALLAEDLSPVDRTKTYELWAIRNGKPAPVTTFRPDSRGNVRVAFPADMTGSDAVGVTVEPAGGSPKPTSDVILSSNVS